MDRPNGTNGREAGKSPSAECDDALPVNTPTRPLAIRLSDKAKEGMSPQEKELNELYSELSKLRLLSDSFGFTFERCETGYRITASDDLTGSFTSNAGSINSPEEPAFNQISMASASSGLLKGPTPTPPSTPDSRKIPKAGIAAGSRNPQSETSPLQSRTCENRTTTILVIAGVVLTGTLIGGPVGFIIATKIATGLVATAAGTTLGAGVGAGVGFGIDAGRRAYQRLVAQKDPDHQALLNSPSKVPD